MWVEFWSTLGSAGLGLLVACTLLNLLAAVWLAQKSLPAKLQIVVNALEAKAAKAFAAQEQIEAQVASWKTQLETLLEANEDAFDRAERKRASAAAAASRASQALGGNAGASGEPPPGATRAERLLWIRSMAGR
jgi:hypothetical protein